jgi:hypothetical protein
MTLGAHCDQLLGMHPDDLALLAFLLLMGAVALLLFFWTFIGGTP